MAHTEEFGEELADFVRRVAELKSARSVENGDLSSVLDAAIFELDHVAGQLWPQYEQLAAHEPAARPSGDRQEHQLMRAIFQRFPLPVVLVDRESVVRRMNFAATGLTGVRAGYATGRALSALLAHADRGAFRSQVAAVARGEGDRSLTVHLQQRPSAQIRATLTAVRPTTEPRTVVLVVLQPADARVPAAEPLPSPVPDLEEATRHTALMDLVDAVATALLTAPAGDPAAVLRRAADVLHGRFADWVVADAGAARPKRTAVLAPKGTDERAVAEQDPATCPLVVEAARGGSTALQVRPADTEAFGRVGSGAPVLAALNVTSLLCVPLAATEGQDAGAVQGVLTLFRTGARLAFSMAEARAVDLMSRHVALAMRRRA